jgi:ABC-2 type transport system permease protein
MIADILTVARKELKEILTLGGGGRRGWLSQLILLGVFGVFLPLQSGRAWVETPLVLFAWAWLPYFLAASTVSDSFAGERERHTLETLLASRLSDRAILFGKALAVVAYASGMAWIVVLLGLATLNIAYWGAGLVMYPPLTGLGIVVFSLLGSGAAAGAGVLISLRAATARQAAQTMSLVIFVLFIPIFILQFLPADVQAQVFQVLERADAGQVAGVAVLVLLVIDAGLLAAALAQFRRARLILDG